MLRCQCPSVCDGSALWSPCMPGRGEGSYRAMLATARPSCSLDVTIIRLRHFTVCLSLCFFLQFGKLQPVTNGRKIMLGDMNRHIVLAKMRLAQLRVFRALID